MEKSLTTNLLEGQRVIRQQKIEQFKLLEQKKKLQEFLSYQQKNKKKL